jgi:hypothetical protein
VFPLTSSQGEETSGVPKKKMKLLFYIQGGERLLNPQLDSAKETLLKNAIE